jgi:hypothetical protein
VERTPANRALELVRERLQHVPLVRAPPWTLIVESLQKKESRTAIAKPPAPR